MLHSWILARRKFVTRTNTERERLREREREWKRERARERERKRGGSHTHRESKGEREKERKRTKPLYAVAATAVYPLHWLQPPPYSNTYFKTGAQPSTETQGGNSQRISPQSPPLLLFSTDTGLISLRRLLSSYVSDILLWQRLGFSTCVWVEAMLMLCLQRTNVETCTQ